MTNKTILNLTTLCVKFIIQQKQSDWYTILLFFIYSESVKFNLAKMRIMPAFIRIAQLFKS